MAGKVFVSHAQEDEQRCAALLQVLDDWGVDYWYDRHEQSASGPLSAKAQQALVECSIFLRICTRNTQRSYWMSIENGAFLGLQADDHRGGKSGARMLVNLILALGYVREPFDRTATVLDASDHTQPSWVSSLRGVLGLPPLEGMEAILAVAEKVSPAPPTINRRRAIGLGVAGAAAIAVAGAGGAVLVLRGRAGQPSAQATPTATPPVHDPQLLWFYDTVDPDSVSRVGISGWPATDGTTVYVGTNDGSTHALDGRTGKFIWKHPTPGGTTIRGVAVGQGFVYGCAKGVGIYALAAANGTPHWAIVQDVLEHSVTVVHNDLIYMTTAGVLWPFIVVADVATGTQRYAIEVIGHDTEITFSIPVIVDDVLYVGDAEGYAYAFDATRGGKPPLWRADVGSALAKNDTSIASTVAVADGTAYFNSGDGAIYALDVRNGARRWRQPLKSGYTSTPAVSDRTVFVGTTDSKVYALDAATGKVRWSYATGGAVRSSPVVADGVVYVGSDDKNVYALDAKSGTLAHTYKTGGVIVSKPLILNDVMYITGLDGFVYAFKR
ncbi:MAG: outer membrane protein assembly factor BamB family protein [Ktedonobacterales bacterium]